MALLEGDERSELPSMSWNSVVDGGSSADARKPSTTVPAGPLDADRSEPPEQAPAAALSFNTKPIDAALDQPTQSTVVSPVSPPPAPSFSSAAVDVDDATVALNRPDPARVALSVPDFEDQLDRTAQPIAPAVDSSVIVERAPVAPESADVAEDVALPPIVEATPPSAVAAELATDEPAKPPAQTPTVIAAEPASAVAPAPQPDPALSLPVATAAVPAAPSHTVFEPGSTAHRPQRKDRSGSIARVGFFFLVVAALVSAAVIFGRPYLFPDDWEPDALEFAEPIEAARGTDFAEPVLLTSQPSSAHRAMVATQLLGEPAAQLPMWRSLGLAGHESTDDETLQALISEQAPVLYSTVDGQVYVDTGYTRSDRNPLISQAMATAALDQQYAFSTDAAARTLDDAALTQAHVMQQAAVIQQNAANSTPEPVTDMATLAFLPSLLDYELTAPSVFVELLPAANDIDSNPLAELGVGGPGPLLVPALAPIASSSAVAGDVSIGATVVTDRSFWYLAFASHLDAVTAYQMSNQLESAGLQMVSGANGTCSVATFGNTAATSSEALRVQLESWVAASAPELAASVVPLTDTTVQLRSCDPVSDYTSNATFGVGRQLIGWRATELAVTNLVVSRGGTVADVDAALGRIATTPSAVAVAQLPAGTTPVDLANAAEAAAIDAAVSPEG